MAVRVYRITETLVPKIRVYNVSGTGTVAAATKVRVYRISGAGAALPSLSSAKSVYEPGELVTVAAANRGATDAFTVAEGWPPGAAVEAGVLTFPAPPLVDKGTRTVSYNGQAYLTLTINPAFVLVGGKPGIIRMYVAEVATVLWQNPLGAGAEFLSGPIDTAGKVSVSIAATADQTFTLRLDTSADGVDFPVLGTPVTATASGADYVAGISAVVSTPYVRARVLIGATAADRLTVTGTLT